MDHPHKVIVTATALCIHQLLAAYIIIFDDVWTASEAKAAKRHRHELTSYSVMYDWLMTTNLEHVPHLERILQDTNWPYMKDITHLCGWQFFLLTDHLKHYIEWPRSYPNGTHPEIKICKKCKMDRHQHLYYCLKWLMMVTSTGLKKLRQV
jgi:hypothetical protein